MKRKKEKRREHSYAAADLIPRGYDYVKADTHNAIVTGKVGNKSLARQYVGSGVTKHNRRYKT